MKTVIIRYNAGNIRSVLNCMERIGVPAHLSEDPAEIRAADRVIFPGVGEASSAMQHLRERGLDEAIRSLKQPVLGICLGMQLLGSHSEENDTACLGIIPARVRRLPADLPEQQRQKVPHTGWNRVVCDEKQAGRGLFEGIDAGQFFYFVHAYSMELSDATIAVTQYGVPFSSAVQCGNFFGVQFHPEKSAGVGERLIRNFLTK